MSRGNRAITIPKKETRKTHFIGGRPLFLPGFVLNPQGFHQLFGNKGDATVTCRCNAKIEFVLMLRKKYLKMKKMSVFPNQIFSKNQETIPLDKSSTYCGSLKKNRNRPSQARSKNKNRVYLSQKIEAGRPQFLGASISDYS